MNPAEGGAAVTFEPNSRTFTFYHDSDLSLSGEEYYTYQVQVTGKSGAVIQAEGKTMFYFDVRNPCIDRYFVDIV